MDRQEGALLASPISQITCQISLRRTDIYYHR